MQQSYCPAPHVWIRINQSVNIVTKCLFCLCTTTFVRYFMRINDLFVNLKNVPFFHSSFDGVYCSKRKWTQTLYYLTFIRDFAKILVFNFYPSLKPSFVVLCQYSSVLSKAEGYFSLGPTFLKWHLTDIIKKTLASLKCIKLTIPDMIRPWLSALTKCVWFSKL